MAIDFIQSPTTEIAQLLLGKLLVHETPNGRYSGYIVETEAYLGEVDEACHTYQGKRTPKVESMFKEGGHIYVYSMHTHYLLNIVTKEKDNPQAVLIRAIEPIENKARMEKNRQMTGWNVTNGPGKLTQAMEINKKLDGSLLNSSTCRLEEEGSRLPKKIGSSKRIGVPNKGQWTDASLRFFVEGNPYVSGMKKAERKSVIETWY